MIVSLHRLTYFGIQRQWQIQLIANNQWTIILQTKTKINVMIKAANIYFIWVFHNNWKENYNFGPWYWGLLKMIWNHSLINSQDNSIQLMIKWCRSIWFVQLKDYIFKIFFWFKDRCRLDLKKLWVLKNTMCNIRWCNICYCFKKKNSQT